MKTKLLKDTIRMVLITNAEVRVLDNQPETVEEAVLMCEDFFKLESTPTICAISVQIRPTGHPNFCPFFGMRVSGDNAVDYSLTFTDVNRNKSVMIFKWDNLVELKAMAERYIEFFIKEVGGEPIQQFDIELHDTSGATRLMRRYANSDGVKWVEG